MAHVQTAKSSGNSAATSVTVSIGTTTSGNLLVIGVTWYGSRTFSSISDNKSNTWTQIGSQLDTASPIHTRMYYAKNISGGSGHTITVNFSGNGCYPTAIASEFSELDTSSPLDVQAGTTGGASTTPSSGSTTTRSTANQLLVCFEAEESTATCTHTAGTNYTKPTNGSEDDGSNYGTAGIEYRIVSATGTDAGTWTIGQNVKWACQVATFKYAGGTTYNQSVSGSATPSGITARQTAKSPSGAVTPAGAIARQTAKRPGGAVALAGTLVRRAGRSLAGAVIPAGALSKAISKGLAGSAVSSGTLAKRLARAINGAIAAQGSLTRNIAKGAVGDVTPSGTFSKIKAILLALSGSATPSGTITRSVGRSWGGSLSPNGAMAKSLSRRLTGALSSSGTLAKQIAKYIGGAVSQSGTLERTKVILVSLSGSVSSVGQLSRSIWKTLAAELGLHGELLKRADLTTIGAMVPSGGLTRSIARFFSGAVAAAAALFNEFAVPPTAIINLYVAERSFELEIERAFDLASYDREFVLEVVER